MNTHKEADSFFSTVTDAKKLAIGFKALEQQAKDAIDPHAFSYIQAGAGKEETLRKNESSFEKYSIVPRFLTDVSNLDPSIQLFGRHLPVPILFSPIGMQRMAHEKGEIASSKAAGDFSLPFIQSTVSSYSIEEIAAETKDSPKWFQLYWSNNTDISFSMVERAEKAGYEAIVLTVDTVQMGWRESDLRNQFSPLKQGLGKANYVHDPVFMDGLKDHEEDTIIEEILANIYHPSLHWDDLKKLKEKTALPILLKGILHPEDAKLSVQYGVDGIIVSNHGGRQLDGVISSIDALPQVVQAVEGRVPVIFDSGIRRGADIVRALSLGATAVCIGRPYIYALAVNGEQGVKSYVTSLIDEFTTTMGLAGANTIKQLRNITIQS